MAVDIGLVSGCITNNVDRNSLLQLESTLSQDQEFAEWCTRWLDILLGVVPIKSLGVVGNQGRQMQNELQLVERLTNQMQCSFLLGVQVLGPQSRRGSGGGNCGG